MVPAKLFAYCARLGGWIGLGAYCKFLENDFSSHRTLSYLDIYCTTPSYVEAHETLETQQCSYFFLLLFFINSSLVVYTRLAMVQQE